MASHAGSYLALDPATLADPYPLYEALRRQGHPVREETYGVWLVTRYADIVQVVRRPELFSSAVAPAGPPPDLSAVPDDVRSGLLSAPAPPRTLVTADPPAHTRYRTVLNRFLNVKRTQAWEPRIREIADELVDGFVANGRCELVADFAGPLPLRVVAEFLGMAPDEQSELRRWADEAAEGIGNPPAVVARLRSGIASVGEGFAGYFRRRIAERRRAPLDGDFVSDLVRARTDDGRLLNDDELLSILGHFLVAGHETSTKMIATGMLLLLQHPEALAEVRSAPEFAGNLVEEVLRLDAPVQGMFRVATADTDVAGVPIAAGEMLMLLYGSGNRDDQSFPHAARFDIHRSNARAHLSFGQGAHYCAGAPFARAEGRIGFEVLVRRLPELRLVADQSALERPPSFILRGLRELEVAFTPAT